MKSFREIFARNFVRVVAFLCPCIAFSPAFSRAAEDPGVSDRATLIVLAPVGPVFVDLHLTVSRVPYREWVARFLATDMDVDHSGRLNETELNLLTDSIRSLAGVSSATEILREMQAEATDIDVEDFIFWLGNRIPRAFDLIAQPQPADDAVRLAALLDTDYDGAISDEELTANARTLRFRDLDNDETFSVSELLPYRDPRSENAAVAPDAVSLPFFHVIDRDSARRAAERIVQRYGKEGRISAELLRQHGGVMTVPGATDRPLSIDDVQSVIEAPHFHMTMEVSLSVKANTSNIKVAVDRDASTFCRSAAKQAFGEYSLVIDGQPLKMVALGGSANDRRSSQGYLGQTFVMSDSDRNQYLDENEFSGMLEALNRAGVRTNFTAVDFNGDAMVTREEVFSFARRDQMAAASRVEVSVRQDGKTLFGILDRNSDRRLSARELRSGSTVLKTYDVNQDHKFADSELGTEFVLAFSLGRPEFRRTAGRTDMMSMQMRTGDAILPGAESLRGPEWFRRMDRNQDGDVSPREFLGTARHFVQIDSDLDQLISADEAISLDGMQ